MRIIGIYRIYHKETNQSYIGYSNNLSNLFQKIDSHTHPAFNKIPDQHFGFETIKCLAITDDQFFQISQFKITVWLTCQASTYIKQYDSINNGYNKTDPYDLYRTGSVDKTDNNYISPRIFNSFIKNNQDYFSTESYPTIKLFTKKDSSSTLSRPTTNDTNNTSYTFDQAITLITRTQNNIVVGYHIRKWLEEKGIMYSTVQNNGKKKYWPTDAYTAWFEFSRTGKQFKFTQHAVDELRRMFVEENIQERFSEPF